MEERADLSKLENMVEKLLSAYNQLTSDKQELEESLLQSQGENEQLQNQVSLLQEEKSHVHDRVAGLLGTIEDWEKTQNQAETFEADEADEEVSDFEANSQSEVESSSHLFTNE